MAGSVSPVSLRRALRLFVEETAVARRAAVIDPLERRMARAVAEWFVAQGRVMVSVLAQGLAARMDAAARRVESVTAARLTEAGGAGLSWNDWDYLLTQVMGGHHPGGLFALRDIISDGRTTAYTAGADALLGELGVEGLALRIGVGSDEAIAHARAVAAAQVTRINATTRDQLRTVITQAVERGWSWNRTAEAITERYAEFAGRPLFPSQTYTSRAEMVAAYEIGDAYESGNEAQARQAEAEGIPMEKGWLNAGDARVRPAHQANAAAGWLPLDATFPDGSTRSPTDAGCRCAMMYRVKPGYFADEEDEATAAVSLAPLDLFTLRPEQIGQGVAQSAFRNEASERARQRAMKLTTRWDRVTSLSNAALDLDLELAQAIEAGAPEATLVELEKRLKRVAILRRKALDHYHAGVRSALALPESRRSPFTAIVGAGDRREQLKAAVEETRQFVSAETLGAVRVSVSRTTGSRAYANGNDIFLTGSPVEHTGSAIYHEMGHVIETNNELAAELAYAFRARRTRGETPVPLGDYGDFDAIELTLKDEFLDPYMGKIYEHGGTEIVSTGFQYMRYSPEDLAARDPDYFHFMFHLLRGDMEYLAGRMTP